LQFKVVATAHKGMGAQNVSMGGKVSWIAFWSAAMSLSPIPSES